jgi:hypothetical protein
MAPMVTARAENVRRSGVLIREPSVGNDLGSDPPPTHRRHVMIDALSITCYSLATGGILKRWEQSSVTARRSTSRKHHSVEPNRISVRSVATYHEIENLPLCPSDPKIKA